MFKEEIVGILARETRLRVEEISSLIEIPPNFEMGDYAFPCFVLSKREKKSPAVVAEHIVKNLKSNPNWNKSGIKDIRVSGAYINFFVDKMLVAEEILGINSNYGRQAIGKKRKIIIDFSGPNIGKPMHIGHIRSTIIGDSLMRIYDYLGYNPIGINYLGDIGLHIGKLIVAYELWVNKENLKNEPVNELLRLYVKFCGEEKSSVLEGQENELEEFQNNEWTNKAKEKLRLLELGDKKTEKIWNEIRKYSGKGFNKVYDLLNINFNENVGQSEFSKKGKEIVISAIEKGFAKSDSSGAVYVENKGIKKYILRSNKTASYITYDLGAAVERFNKYKFDKMIYVTDFRQSEHFKQLFSILDLFGYEFSFKMSHLGFGTVKFGNEIVKTREGNIILLEDVLKRIIEKAEEEISKRKTKGDSEKVGVGAIKYIILKNEPMRDVQFSWESALSFEGNTGPYLQYSYARASSIIQKAGNFNKNKFNLDNFAKSEIKLVKKISDFPEIVKNAGERLNPSLIANYSFELCKIFNEFYVSCPVLKSDNESFRLRLIDSFRTCLKNALYLLGIEVMNEM